MISLNIGSVAIKKLVVYNHLLLTLLLLPGQLLIAQKNELPNILVFMADDAGMDFRTYGNTAIKTPHIDALAAGGLTAHKAFLTSSQCSPTRTSILAGQFAHSIGTEDLHIPLRESTKLIPYYLKQKGYHTGLLMKTHIGKHGEEQFDQILKGSDKEAPKLFSKFLDASAGKPFFSWVAFTDPHRPYGDNWNGAPVVHDPQGVIVPPYFVDDSATRKDLALYYDEIHRMDKNIGAMLADLAQRGLRENTLVIFLSDNGMPFPRGKATLYDLGIQTPLIFNWPRKIPEGTQYQGLISAIDLAPTVLEAAGIEKPQEMYGESIAGIFEDQQLPGRDYVFAERNWHDTDAHMRCVRSEEYKLIINGYPELPFPIIADFRRAGTWWDLIRHQKQGNLNPLQQLIFDFPRYKVELYHVKNDPLESRNLITEEAELEEGYKLLEVLRVWRKETQDYPSHQKRRDDYIDRKSAFKIIQWQDPYHSALSDYWDQE